MVLPCQVLLTCIVCLLCVRVCLQVLPASPSSWMLILPGTLLSRPRSTRRQSPSRLLPLALLVHQLALVHHQLPRAALLLLACQQ